MSAGQKSRQTIARTSGWVKRTIHAAVVVAVAASVPAAWSAGGAASIQVNNVAAGHAVISQAGNITTIRTASQNTIINYQRFDVNSGQTVNFAQPNAASRVLNRIQGDAPSSINGTITSNGIVYLVNPAGIMFGPGAVVNVGQFFAAGARMSDQDFLSGANHFTDAAGRVENAGLIRANQVHLAGLQVGNTGMIVTDGSAGIVTMTAGNDIWIGEVSNAAAQPLIMVKMTAPGSTSAGGAAVSNSGTINVGKGQVLLGAGDVYGIAIMNSGSLVGKSITLQGGQGITESTGKIDASSLTGTGGSVTLTGEKVGVSGLIDASGATGGGAVRIGGGFHGGEGLPSAANTVVTSSASIKADATGTGDGGTVAVWSSSGTLFGGSISARRRAGSTGGFVEVSGGQLGFAGTVDVASPGGTAGTILLDPNTLTIDTTGTDDASFTGNINFADTPTTMSISAAKLITLLESGSLTLQAHNLIDITTNVDATTDALTAGNGLTFQVDPAGTIKIENGVTVKTNNAPLEFDGNVQLHGGTATIGAGTGALATLTFDGKISDAGTTNLSLAGDTLSLGDTVTTGGTLSINSTSATSGLSIDANLTGSAITLTSNAEVTNTAAIDTSGAGGDVTISSATISLSGGTITAGAGNVNLYNVVPANPISLASGPALSYVLTAGDLGGITSAAHIIIGQSGSQVTITANQLDAGAITIPITLNANGTAGTVALNDGGTATALAVGGDLTINAGTVGITATTANNAFAEISAAGTVALNSSGAIGTAVNQVQFASGQTGVTLGGTSIHVDGLGSLGLVTATASAGAVDISTEGTGNINASGLLSASTTVALDAGGGIGTGGTISVLAPSGLTLTTAGLASAGNISISTTAATLLNPAITVDVGGGQTISLTGNALSFTSDLDVGTANLVLSGTSLNVGAAATITAKNFTVTGITAGGATVAGTLTLSGDFLSNGTGDFTLTGGSITAGTVRITAGNVTDGGTGFVSATDLGVIASGNVTLTDATSNAVGTFAASAAVNKSITLKNSSTLTVGSVSAVTNFALTTGVTTSGTGAVTLQSDGTMTVSQVVTGGSAGASLKTVTGNINGTATVSGTSVTVNAAGGIGLTGSGLSISASGSGAVSLTTAGLASAGNITVSTGAGALNTPTISVDSGGGQTISLTSGALTFTNSLNVGTADLVLSATSLNVGGSATITAGNFTVTGITAGGATVAGTLSLSGDFLSNGTGDFTLTGGSISAGNVRITAGNVTDGGTGFVSATDLGVIATGNITLTDATSNAVGTFAASAAVNKSITFKNSSTLSIGTVTAVTNFAGVTGVTTSGTGAVTLQSDGTMTVSQVVTAGSGGASLKTVTAGDIDGTATVSGTSVTVNAAGGIGLTGSGLSISASGSGAVSLTTAGLASAGNITVSTGAGALNTPTISIDSGGGQTVTFGGGAVTLGNTNLSGAALVVNATSFAITASDTVSASTAKIALTGGATISGTLNLTGEFDSTGTTFGVSGDINSDSGNINILHTGAVTISGTLETDFGTIRIAGSTVTENAGAIITADTLGVRATGAGAAIDLEQTNNINTFGGVTTTSGASVNLTTSNAVDLDSVSGVAASSPFPTFAAITNGVTTVNGDVTVNGGNSVDVESPIAAGTGTVGLFTPGNFGLIQVDAAITGGIVELGTHVDVNVNAAIHANNGGSGGFESSGVNFDLTSSGSIATDGTATLIHTGAVTFEGSASAITLNIQGQTVTQTTGTLTATNLGVKATGTGVGVGNITLPGVTLNASGQVAAATASGKTISITTSGSAAVGSASSTTALSNTGGTLTFAALSGINSGTGTSSLTATTGNITGSQTVTGATVNLTATTGGIGTTSTAVGVSATNINLTTGGSDNFGDIYINTGGAAVNTSTLSVTTDALSDQTISIVSGAFTVDADFDIGTDDLQVGGTTFTSNAGKTLTVGDLLFVGSGQVSLAGTINAGSGGGEILFSAADVIQTGGALTAEALSTITNSKNGSNQAVQLTAGTNDITIFVAKSTSASGTVALTTSGATTIGSTGSAGGTGGVGTFAANLGVATSNANITIKADGDFDSYEAIDAGTGTVAIWTLPSSAGDLVIHTSAPVTGATVNFAADGNVSIASTVTATNAGAGVFTSTGGGDFDLVSGGSVTTDVGTVVHTGDVNLGASLSATTLDLQGATIGQTAGLVTATTLGLRSTTNGATLTNLTFNAGGTVAAVAPVNENITLTSTNGMKIGSAASSLAPNNAGTNSSFAPILGVTTTGTGITSLTATTGNITGDGTDPVGGTTVNLTATAGGIGSAGTDVIVNTTGTATLTTGGAGSAGDVHMTTSGSSLGAFTFTTAAGSVQTINIDKTGSLTFNGNMSTVNDNLVVTAIGALALGNSVAIGTGTGSITLQAGTSGTGNLSFGTSDTLTSPTVLLEAGSQNGTDATAVVDITNVPTLSTTTSLTVRQDGSITDAGIDGSGLTSYTLQSDGGNVTVSTGANVSGTMLTLISKNNAANFVEIGGTVSLYSLDANPGSTLATIDLDGSVTTTPTGATVGDQTYHGNVEISQDITLTANVGTAAGSGNVTFEGTVTSPTAKTLGITAAALVDFQKSVGGAVSGGNELGTLTVGGTGTVEVSSGAAISLTTTGAQTYNLALTLLGNTTINADAGGAVTFGSTVDSQASQNFTLAVNTSGVTWFKDNVGAGTNGVLGSLTTDFASGVGEKTKLGNGGSVAVNTSGIQLYNDAVELDADATLTSTGTGAAGNITFSRTVDGAQALVVNTSGTTIFNGQVGGTTALASVTTDLGTAGSTQINGGAVHTSTFQTYNDPLTIGTSDATLTSDSTGASGDITFNNTVDGPKALTVNTSGDTLFNSIVGGNTALSSLTTDAGTAGTTKFNIGGVHTVLTVNAQSYGDDVVLANDTVFNSNAGGDITFHKTVNGISAGGQAMSVNTTGDEVFDGQVGGGTNGALATLTTDDPTSGITGLPSGLVHFNYASSGPTDFSVNTTGDQNYHDNVLLGANTVLSSTGVAQDITFSGTINATTAGGQSLTVNAVGDEFFDGKIGGSAALASLTTDDPLSAITFIPFGNVHFNYASTDVSLSTPDVSVLTTGPQSYNDNAILGNNTVLKSTGAGSAGDIDFDGILNGTTSGGQALTVISAGVTTFNGIVGGVEPLLSLTTDAAGSTVFNNASPTTTTAQDFFDPVYISSDTIFTSNPGSPITFHSTVDSVGTTPYSLAVVSDTDTTFEGAVGSQHPLLSLTVVHNPLSALPGTIYIEGGSVTTTGSQSYEYDVQLNSSVSVGGIPTTVLTSTTGGDISFTTTLDGKPATSAQALTVNTSGTTEFLGLVGGTTPLDSLTTDAAGSTLISGGGVTTVHDQTFNDPVVLGASAAMNSNSAGTITFNSTVDGSSNGGQALTVNSAGDEVFAAKVGGGLNTALASLTTDDPASGVTGLPGGTVHFNYASSDVTVTTTDFSVTTTGFQEYNDAVELGGDTVLKSTGAGSAGNITFGLAVNAASSGTQALAVLSAGTTTFLGAVGTTPLRNLATDAAGTTDINGGSVTTTVSQVYGDDVILSADTTLTASATGLIHFSKTVEGTTSGGQSLTIFSVTDTIFGDSTAATVGDTTPLHNLVVTHTGILGGTIYLNGSSINTTGIQTYNYQVVLGNDVTLNSTGAGALGNITFASTIDATTSGGQALTVNSPGDEIFNGKIGGNFALASLTTDDPASLISGVPGGSTQFNYDSTSATDFSVTTTGLQKYNDAAILGNNTVLSSTTGGDITFAGTVNATTAGAQALTVNTSGDEFFDGNVGATALTSLTTDDPASGVSSLPGGSVHFNYASTGPTDFSVTTTTLQTYNDSIVLGANTVLSSTAGGIITLGTLSAGTTVDGGFALTVNTSANEIVNSKIGGATALASLTTDDPASGVSGLPGGSIHFNYVSTGPTDFSVTTTGLQKYNDSIFLGANTILSSTGGGTITLGTLADGTSVNGAFALTINSAGDEVFNSQIGGTVALASVTTDDPASGITGVPGGTVYFNYASSDLSLTTTDISVATTGTQLYYDNAILGADTVLKTTGDGAAGDIEFFQTLDGTTAGAQGLTVLSTGAATTFITFNGVVGGTVALRSLTTDAVNGHTVFNNAPPTTTLSQDFFDDVILMTDTTFTSPAGSSITFHKTINSFDSTPRALTIISDTDTTFLGAIGNIHPLSTLTVIHNPASVLPGTIYLDGGTITTTGAQSYEYRAVLGSATNATVLTSTGVGAAGDITFTSTLDTDAAHSFPPQALTVNTAGTLTFMDLVGGNSPLSTLTAQGGGITAINGGGVATTGFQTYDDAVTLGTTPAVLSSTATTDSGDIHFYATVNGPEALTVTTSGATTFDGAVGATTALASLTTNGGGNTAINGGAVATTGAQSYDDSVTLGTAAAVLTSSSAGDIHFFSTVDGAEALTVTTSGATTFDDVVGGITHLVSLTTDGGGATAINGGAVSTSTFQTYDDAVTLGVDTVLNGTAITFASSLNSTSSARNLTINNTSNVVFAGPTGNNLTLGALNVTGAAGTTTITGPMTVGSLTIADIAAITGTVTSAGAVSVAGTSTITGTMTSTNSTISLTGASIVHGALHASGDITTGSTLGLTGTVASSTGDITIGGLLTVNSGGLTALVGSINLNDGGAVAGTLTDGQNVTVTGNLTQTGALHAGNNVTVSGSAGITGNVLATAGTITIDGPATLNGTLTAGTNVHAPGAITLGSSLVVTAHGSGGITLGNITGSPTSTLKFVTTDTTDASGPIIRVGSIGTSAGRIGNLEFDSAFVTRLGGDIYANLVTFAGSTGGALPNVPTIATISHDSGDLTIDTNGFTMEQNQKLSVFDKNQLPTDHSIQGSLTILSHGGTIQLGDLSASGNITVNAGSVLDKIVIIARNGGNYLKSDGTTGTDHGLDIVSGAAGTGSLNFTGTLSILVPVGVNASSLVQFAAPLGQQNLKSSPTLRFDNTGSGGIKLLTQDQTITINAATFEAQDFATSGTVLDLAASGVGNPVSSLGTVIAQDLQVLVPDREQAISGALKDALQELGIYARDLRTDEIVDFLIGRALYDDVPYKLNPSPSDNQVSSNRLPYSPVIPTVDAYRALFLKGEVDKNGKPVLDAHGKQKMQAQDTVIKNTFGLTWQMYSKDKKTDATPGGYRAYLEANEGTNAKCAAALGYLNKLRDLLNEIKSLGLTDTEFDVSKKVILAKVRPANIKESDFLAVVMGPSTRSVASR